MRTLTELLAALHAADYRVQEGAVDELVAQGAVALPALIEVLREFPTWQSYEEDHGVHSYAEDALAQISQQAPDAALPLLLPLLQDEGWGVRFGAVYALRILADVRAVRPLLLAFQRDQHEWHNELLDALEFFGDAALPDIAEALTHQAALVRCAAAQLLGTMADERAIPLLVDALNDREGRVRVAAANALALLLPSARDQRAFQPLRLILLRDPSLEARQAAAGALRALGYDPDSLR